MKYEIYYTVAADKDLEKLRKSGDKFLLNKLKDLLLELEVHPYTGTGKPERLRGSRAGQWSRRITAKHRLVYTVDEDTVVVLILSAAGHYGDK